MDQLNYTIVKLIEIGDSKFGCNRWDMLGCCRIIQKSAANQGHESSILNHAVDSTVYFFLIIGNHRKPQSSQTTKIWV